MPRKVFMIAGVMVFVMALLGLAIYVAQVCLNTQRELRDIEKQESRYTKILDAARQEARDVVRAKLRRESVVSAKSDATAQASRQAAALKRRMRARRFFGSRGFVAYASYKEDAAMPSEAPTELDQEIIDLAGESVSEADLDTAAEVAEAALKSMDPRARIAAVEMLSGLGEAGLVDISEFLRDPHPEVANLAADRWELGIQDLTDEREQVALAKVGFLAITDEDQLRSLGGTLMLVQDAALTVGVLTEVIRDGETAQKTAAKEAYEGVTGEKWVDEKTAKMWLDENYEPSEADDPIDASDSDESGEDAEQDDTEEEVVE